MAVVHKYFFALQPDGPAVRRAARLIRALSARPGLDRPMAPARLHVSMNAVGAGGGPLPDWADRAVAAAASVRFPSFVLELNRLAPFGRGEGPRALVLCGDEGVLGADLLRERIHQALADARLAPGRLRPFEAHLTLARGRYAGGERAIAPVAWRVREFVLIHSLVGETRHEIVARFPLSA